MYGREPAAPLNVNDWNVPEAAWTARHAPTAVREPSASSVRTTALTRLTVHLHSPPGGRTLVHRSSTTARVTGQVSRSAAGRRRACPGHGPPAGRPGHVLP